MNDRLPLWQVGMLMAYAAGMACGQVLFKLAALRVNSETPLNERLAALLQNGFFVTAVAWYALLAVLWVWILSVIPLSRAYPFVALAFAIVPLLGNLLFNEPISVRLIIGVFLVLVGLFFVVEQ